jgi:hypothetical protein
MRYPVLWAVVLLLCVPIALTQMEDTKAGGDEEQIRKLSEEGRQAALKNDPSFLETNTTDDYMNVTGNGQVLTRADIIDMRKTGQVKYSSLDPSEQKVRLYGDTAVFSGVVNMQGTMKGRDISGKYRISQTWVKQGGNWKLASMQSTKIQEPQK